MKLSKRIENIENIVEEICKKYNINFNYIFTLIFIDNPLFENSITKDRKGEIVNIGIMRIIPMYYEKHWNKNKKKLEDIKENINYGVWSFAKALKIVEKFSSSNIEKINHALVIYKFGLGNYEKFKSGKKMTDVENYIKRFWYYYKKIKENKIY